MFLYFPCTFLKLFFHLIFHDFFLTDQKFPDFQKKSLKFPAFLEIPKLEKPNFFKLFQCKWEHCNLSLQALFLHSATTIQANCSTKSKQNAQCQKLKPIVKKKEEFTFFRFAVGRCYYVSFWRSFVTR